MFDLAIVGGTVLDPATGLRERADLGIKDGRVVALESKIAPGSADSVLDAAGCYVTAGWVDMHAHVFWGVNWFAVDADTHCTASGVTTVVDFGSAGSVNFPGFRRYIVEPARTRVLALVHLAQHGIQPRPAGELINIQYADPDGACAQANQNADIVVGIKVRLGDTMVGDNGPEALRLAMQTAEAAKQRLMVHIGDTLMPLEDIIDVLRPGDVVTHCFHGLREPIVDANGTIRPVVARARERGVRFDLGHASSFMMSFEVAKAALTQSFAPDTLSTDAFTIRRVGGRDPGFDLPSILTKFLALGMSLEEVIAACTIAPARAIGWDDRLGKLVVGCEADVTVFRVAEGSITSFDTEFRTVEGDRQVQPMWTIRAGRAAPARFNSAFRELPPPRLVYADPPRCCG